jgi:hypothetical protein
MRRRLNASSGRCGSFLKHRGRRGDFETPNVSQFYERQFVGSITIDLVGNHEDEYALFLVAAKRFDQIERAARVDVEILKRHLRSQVARRLSRAKSSSGGGYRVPDGGSA